MIYIHNISKKFGKHWAVKNLSVEFHKGKVYALIGPNGSGKTTLIKCILGLVVPSDGDILLNENSILNAWKYRENIGYMPQVGRYPDNLRIGQLFDMMRDIRTNHTQSDMELYEAFGLDKIHDKRMHTLSGGTRQKVSAALAFLFDPPVLILDEPTAGLDPISVEYLKEKITKESGRDKLIIITSHIMSDLDGLVTDLVYLYEGHMVYNDEVEALKRDSGEFRLGKAIIHLMNQIELPV